MGILNFLLFTAQKFSGNSQNVNAFPSREGVSFRFRFTWQVNALSPGLTHTFMEEIGYSLWHKQEYRWYTRHGGLWWHSSRSTLATNTVLPALCPDVITMHRVHKNCSVCISAVQSYLKKEGIPNSLGIGPIFQREGIVSFPLTSIQTLNLLENPVNSSFTWNSQRVRITFTERKKKMSFYAFESIRVHVLSSFHVKVYSIYLE